MNLELRPLTRAELPAFKELLGGPSFGGCFCAVWTSHDANWVARCGDPAQPNYAVTEKRVQAGEHVGYLVFRAGALIGWTGSGPKAAFPFLARKLGSRLSPVIPSTWAIGCIAIPERFRGVGLSGAIIEAVAKLARESGAKALEAYPTRPWDEARVFRGCQSTYLSAGFEEAGSDVDGDLEILLMRRELGPP